MLPSRHRGIKEAGVRGAAGCGASSSTFSKKLEFIAEKTAVYSAKYWEHTPKHLTTFSMKTH
jgi:hypothetical protein